MGGKVHDTVLIELCLLDTSLGGVRPDIDMGQIGVDAGGNLL